MLKKILSLGLLVASFTIARAQSTWTLDKAHAKLGFSISHMSISEVEGSFKSFDVKVVAPGQDFTNAAVELTADVNTINTEDEARDKHLKNEDFFDAPKYPTMTFKSTSFKKKSNTIYEMTGNLTMHGVTKQVKLEVHYGGSGTHPYTKKTIAGFKVKGKIKRSDFNLSPNTPTAVLGDEVTINANMELEKA